MSYNWAKGCRAWFLNEKNSLNNSSMKNLKKYGFNNKTSMDIVFNSPLLKDPKSQMLFFYKIEGVYDPVKGGAGSIYIGKMNSLIDAYKETVKRGYNYFYYYPNKDTYVRNNVVRGNCSRGLFNLSECPRIPVYIINPWPFYEICSRINFAARANNAYLGVEKFENRFNMIDDRRIGLIYLLILILILFFIVPVFFRKIKK
jgi:hypothetical protein